MENAADSELAQKRERGRNAQRAFRQRQINTIRELKDKNQELTDVIEKITQQAARFSRIKNPSARDRASLDTAIQEARSLAGVPPLKPGNDGGAHIQGGGSLRPPTSNNSVEKSTPVIYTTGVDPNQAPSRASSPSLIGSVEDMIFAQDFRKETAQNKEDSQWLASRQYNSHTDSYFPSQETGPTTAITATGGRVSPRLTYGVWFEPDRFIRIINPPGDIVPYLGSNINTLTGALFWAGLGYGFTVLKEVLRMRANSNLVRSMSLSQNPGTLPLVTRLFGHSIEAAGPNADGEQILHDIIHARFTWRKQGYIPGDHPGADPEIPNRLFGKVVENLTAVPFPTLTSKISVRDSNVNKSNNSRNSKTKSPDVGTSNDVEDLYEGTARASSSNHPTITITATTNESTPSDRDISNWLTPAEIEAYVKARLNAPIPTTSPETSTFGGPPATASTSSMGSTGSINYSSFESAFQSRIHQRGAGNHKPNSTIRASMLKRLVRTLSDKGACFGNSPRWRTDVVSQAVDNWMAEVEAAERAATMGLSESGFEQFGVDVSYEHGGNVPPPGSTSSGWDTGFAATGMAVSSTGTGNNTNSGTGTGTDIGTGTSAPQWYIPGFGLQASQEHGYDYQFGHGQGLGVTSSSSPGVSGIAPTTTAAPAYGAGGSSSSSWYGSDSDGVGVGIPEGMVF
ncbi:hypothetical protein V8F20_003505 [Naviculisporaceae sp. PSN 640]